MSLKSYQDIFEFIGLSILIGFFLVAALIFSLNINTPWQHFSDQAQSFIHGRLDLKPLDFDQHDYVLKDGKYYWPEGPFPSVLLIPFQLIFGPQFHQGTAQLMLIIMLSFFAFRLARLKKFNILSSIYLSAVFLLGSTLVGLILDPKSWFFAQVVSATLLTFLILELETSKRWWLIGILEAALIATRPTAGLIIFVFILLIYKEKTTPFTKWAYMLGLLIPVILSSLLIMWFNYARFGNPLDNGYFTNAVSGFIAPLRELGLFNPIHIPTNFYYYFLSSVEPVTSQVYNHLQFPFIRYDFWGLSFFLVAPFFLYALKSFKNPSYYLGSLWFVIAITLFFHLTYYTPGWIQFGPRYTADFMPILYLLTLYGLDPPNLNGYKKSIILINILFNLYLLSTRIFF